ncbi:MAG: hypothetical protein ACP5NC_07695 [Nitrososphaeria archaeon]
MKIAKPTMVLIAIVVISWMLLLASFYAMAITFKFTAGMHGLAIQIIRDLLGFLLFVIWAVVFYIMRQVAAKALSLY